MKSLKYILSCILYLCSYSALFAAPQAEADFIKLVKEYTFRPDGSMEFHYSKQLKINTHLALNNLYGETFIVYNPRFQSLKFNTSYTRQADGQIVSTPPNAFNEVLPSSAADAPAYNYLKEMVVTHTGLELGATIFLDYTLTSKPGYFDKPDLDEILQEESPVKEYTVIINIPAGQELHYLLSGKKAKPHISTKGELKQYRWTLKNIPAASREPFQTPYFGNAPRLIATGYLSTKDALTHYLSRFQFRLSPENILFTRNLVKDQATNTDKIFALQQFIVHRISNIGIPADLTAYTLRSPDEVLESAYGTAAEKTQTFMAMLKALDFNPDLVAVYPAGLNIKGIKPMTQLKIKVDEKARPLFLSALSEPVESPELRGNRDEIWLISSEDIRPLIVINSKGKIHARSTVRLSPSQADLDVILSVGGLLPIAGKKEEAKLIKAFSAGFGKIISLETLPEDSRLPVLKFSAQQAVSPVQGYLLYTLPFSSKGVQSWRMNKLNTQRKSILEIPYAINETYEYEILPEAGLKLASKPVEIHKNNAVGSFDLSIRQEGDTIRILKRIQLDKALISPADYPNLRDLMNLWFSQESEKIVLH